MDALELGRLVAAILESGRRESTYKLATLSAIVGYSIEHAPHDRGAELGIPLEDLADRVISLYWDQQRDFDGSGPLKQTKMERGAILGEIQRLRVAASAGGAPTYEALVELAHPGRERSARFSGIRLADTRRRVAQLLAQQPLTHLQHLGASHFQADPFLFDDDWLHKKITRAELDRRGWMIILFPGVAEALARLAPLLQPTIELMWTRDVERMNRSSLAHEDIAHFLFSGQRVALAFLADPLSRLQGGRCFYCRRALARAQVEVDHVIPWSRVPVNGLANLVAADGDCNSSKSATLPAPRHIRACFSRDLVGLCEIGRSYNVPLLSQRSKRAVVGVYGTTPVGTPLWVRKGEHEALDSTWTVDVMGIA